MNHGTTSLLRRACLGASALLLAASVTGALAQARPTIKVLAGFPPGAGTDTVARIYAEALAERLGTTVVVENKPGAGGLIATQALKAAGPETPTVMMTIDHQVVMLPLITRSPGFDVQKDLAPVARVLSFNACLAVPAASPAQNLHAYVERVRADPAQGNFGIAAAGSQAQFVGYVVGKHFNIRTNPVAYRGAAPAITDVLGNQIPAVVVPCDALLEHRKAGKVRVLAVAAEQRVPYMPEVPTFAELGVNMPTDNFIAVYASTGMPPELLRQVRESTRQMFQQARFVERLSATGLTPAYGDAEELVRVWERAIAFWGEQVRQSNFQAQ